MKYGVIGAGKMGQNHIKNLKDMEGIDLVGYYDPKTELAIRRYDNVDDLIRECDALTIATPTSLHYETALRCLGKNLLIEKPLSPSIEECKKLKELFQEQKLMIGQIERFSPVVRDLKKAMEDEEVLAIEIHRCSPYDRRIEVSIVDDLMIHDIDLLFNYLTDSKISELYSTTIDVFSKEDYCQIIGKLEDNTSFSITSSRITQDKIRQICVHCKEAYIIADLLNGTIKVTKKATHEENKNEIKYDSTSRESKIILINNLKNELEHFRDSILNDTEPLTNVDEAINNMEIIRRIKKGSVK